MRVEEPECGRLAKSDEMGMYRGGLRRGYKAKERACNTLQAEVGGA